MSKQSAGKLRFGVVGVCKMGLTHCQAIVRDHNKDFVLAAVADVSSQTAKTAGERFGVPSFGNPQALFDSGLVDAVIVATPHYWHPPLTIAAAQAGLHVISEKPLGVTIGAARAMVEECGRRKVALGTMFQLRASPYWLEVKRLVSGGLLGELHRVSMICSDWYRTQAYYDSGSWRGTWDGEGGGVLTNQAPHSLDLFQWIGGMPERVTAVLTTRIHKIEVENTAGALFEYGPDKIGSFFATTAESPGINQLVLCGEKGMLIAEEGKLRLAKLKTPLRRHLRACPEAMTAPGCEWRDLPAPRSADGERENLNIDVIRAFAAHVLRGVPQACSGAEALKQVELTNAIYLSGYENRRVELPVAAARVDRLLRRLEGQYGAGRGGNMRVKSQKALAALLRKR